MRSFVASLLLSLLFASSCDLATSAAAAERATCEAKCGTGGTPVCDVNGMQFINRCIAENCASTTVAFEGPCTSAMGENCNCPKMRDPVCGMGGTTYNNECEMKCANVIMECEKECPCWGE